MRFVLYINHRSDATPAYFCILDYWDIIELGLFVYGLQSIFFLPSAFGKHYGSDSSVAESLYQYNLVLHH